MQLPIALPPLPIALPPLSPEWQWIGLISAIAALVVAIMALPTVAQMFGGRPKVRHRFERRVEGAERFLIVFLDNMPVTNRFLKKLGVRRASVQSLTAGFRISEGGSGQILIPIRQARLYSDDDPFGEGRERIALPPTYSVAASFMVVVWDTKAGKAVVPASGTASTFEITPGLYTVDMTIWVDGEPIRVRRRFVVGQTPDDLGWVSA